MEAGVPALHVQPCFELTDEHKVMADSSRTVSENKQNEFKQKLNASS